MKINNPYNKMEEHYCFCCSERNPIGMNLTFEKEDDMVFSFWEPRKEFQGWLNVLHGGIITTIMDEVAFWALQTFVGTSGVTSELSARFLKPVMMNKGKVKATAVIKEKIDEHHLLMATQLFDGEGVLCAEGDITYFVYPLAVAQRKFHYPGKDAFGLEEKA